MKQKIREYMKKHWYWTYRFDRLSNFMTFEQWIDERIGWMEKNNQISEYIKRNKLDISK